MQYFSILSRNYVKCKIKTCLHKNKNIQHDNGWGITCHPPQRITKHISTSVNRGISFSITVSNIRFIVFVTTILYNIIRMHFPNSLLTCYWMSETRGQCLIVLLFRLWQHSVTIVSSWFTMSSYHVSCFAIHMNSGRDILSYHHTWMKRLWIFICIYAIVPGHPNMLPFAALPLLHIVNQTLRRTAVVCGHVPTLFTWVWAMKFA